MANVVLRCANENLNKIINKKFGDYRTLSLPGGVKWYLSRDEAEELFEQIELLLDAAVFDKLALVIESDCVFYQELGEQNMDQYHEDMLSVIGLIQDRFPNLQVSGYVFDTDEQVLRKVEER